MEEITRNKFIRVGGAVGMSAAAASLLAACGGGSEGGSGGSSSGGSGESSGGSSGGSSTSSSLEETTSETTQAEQAAGGAAIASESEVAPGSAVKFKDSGNPAVLVHLDSGDFVAYSAVCTHKGCTVAYKDGQLACPCHGSVFDPADGGAVVNGPAQQPLPQIEVKSEGGKIVKA